MGSPTLPSSGRKNHYTCATCNNFIVTIDVADGVTPFMIPCQTPGCKGFMQSACYRVPQEGFPVTHEWRAPVGKECNTHHAANGGLFLHKKDVNPVVFVRGKQGGMKQLVEEAMTHSTPSQMGTMANAVFSLEPVNDIKCPRCDAHSVSTVRGGQVTLDCHSRIRVKDKSFVKRSQMCIERENNHLRLENEGLKLATQLLEKVIVELKVIK